jgi:hypothetical protein
MLLRKKTTAAHHVKRGDGNSSSWSAISAWLPPIGYIVGALLVVLLSPLILVLAQVIFEWPLGGQWGTLSDIGQSYTGVSALLSGGALLAVARSTRLQAQQMTIVQYQALRGTQYDNFRMAIENPALQKTYSKPMSGLTFEQQAFLTMRFRHLEFASFAGEIQEQDLAELLKTDVLSDSKAREYWLAKRKGRQNKRLL